MPAISETENATSGGREGPDATRADVLKAIEGHILGKAILMGRFKRP